MLETADSNISIKDELFKMQIVLFYLFKLNYAFIRLKSIRQSFCLYLNFFIHLALKYNTKAFDRFRQIRV